jgi:NADH-quinone oxidoreductase subunit A
VVFRQLEAFGLWEMVVFALAVFVSFVYLIGNGALDWGPAKRMAPTRDRGGVVTGRTTESTVRRVGASGRDEAA